MKKLDEDIPEKIEDTNKNFIKKDLIPFLKIPSYTMNQEGIKRALNYIKSYISDFSNETEEFEGDINPIILSKVEGNNDSYLIIYMMYDTQPIKNKNEWISPPFKANISIIPSLTELGKCIIARGAYNSKTPLISFLNIVKILKLRDKLPFSLFLVFDGEEEMGSPSFPSFLNYNKNILSNSLNAYYPALKQDIEKKAILKLGYKGILSLSINVYTNNEEVHSSYSNIIPNPAQDLIKLINFLHSNNTIQIKSLSKNYKLSAEDKHLIKKLTNEKIIEKISKKAGIIYTATQNPQKFLIRYLFKPTFNISTLKSGFLDEGIKNSVPNYSSCNIDIRFPHNIPVDILYNEIKEKINSFSSKFKSNVEIKRNIAYESSRVSKNSILVESLLNSFKTLNIKTELWPISAAASPLSILKKKYGINYITGGLGIAGNAHTANEFVQLDSILNTRMGFYYFLEMYANRLNKNNPK